MKATVHGAARRALVVAPLAAAALLLAGCVPLDGPGPSQNPPVPAPSQSASAIPGGWEDCQDPVVTTGVALVEGWKVFAVMAVDTGPGGISGTTLLDGAYSPLIFFNDEGSQDLARFTGTISEHTDFPVDGVLSGVESLETTFQDVEGKGRIVTYRAVEEASLPFTLACGNEEARGTLHTWNNTEFGILDCALAPEEPVGSPAALTRKEYCLKS